MGSTHRARAAGSCVFISCFAEGIERVFLLAADGKGGDAAFVGADVDAVLLGIDTQSIAFHLFQILHQLQMCGSLGQERKTPCQPSLKLLSPRNAM